MPSNGPLLLSVGATGGIGRHVVQAAVQQGFLVRALVRDAEGARHFSDSVDVVTGDLTRADTLGQAVYDVDYIVFTQGTYGSPDAALQVDYGGVLNVLAALAEQKPRVSLMTAIGTTDRKGSHDWKRRAERLIRLSGLDYTIVRPGWFDYNSPGQRKLLLSQGDKPVSGSPADGVIARDQLAKVLVRCLQSDAALNKTFELRADSGQEQADFDALFATLPADEPGALDGKFDTDNMPLDGEPDEARQALKRVEALARPG